MTELRPRWKRGAALIDGSLGELLGRTYVDTYFPPASKAMMTELVANLKTAMGARIEHSDWMSADTKKAALEKLSKMDVMVGYPDKWRDYSALKIDAGDLYGNVQRSNRFEWEYQLTDLGKPVDRMKWGDDAADGQRLQRRPREQDRLPRRHPAGAVLRSEGRPGGELRRHRRDHRPRDQPRLRRPGTQDRRDRRRPRLVDQGRRRSLQRAGEDASARSTTRYEPVPGMHINGELTMGENIADLAGVLDRARRLPRVAQGRGGAGARRLHRRPALLSRLRPGVAQQGPRRSRCATR